MMKICLIINNTDIIEQLNKTHFKCQTSNKYIHQSLVKNGNCDCGYIESDWCEDENLEIIRYSKEYIISNNL